MERCHSEVPCEEEDRDGPLLWIPRRGPPTEARGSQLAALLQIALLACAAVFSLAPLTVRADRGSRTIKDLRVAWIQYSDLPPLAPINPYGNAYDCAKKRVYGRYTAVMPSGAGFYCYPLKALSHLGWKQGAAEYIANQPYKSWTMCAYLFDSATHAHAAYVAFHHVVMSTIKQLPGTSRLALPKLGNERVGMAGPDIPATQIDFRESNAVVEMRAPEDIGAFHGKLVSIAKKVDRRLR